MKSFWIRVSPKSSDQCLYNRKGRDIWRQRPREAGQVMMEVEIGKMQLQAKGHAKEPPN